MKPTKKIAQKLVDLLPLGLTCGLGARKPGKMCVEALAAFVTGEEHNDNPSCVDYNLSMFKIHLNDEGLFKSNWDRANQLRRIAVAQLGSDGLTNWNKVVVDLVEQSPEYQKNVVEQIVTGDSDFSIALREFMLSWWKKNPHGFSDIEDTLGYEFMERLFEDLSDDESGEDLAESMLDLFGSDNVEKIAEFAVKALIKLRCPGARWLNLVPKKLPKKASASITKEVSRIK